jgi:hypothetical protein
MFMKLFFGVSLLVFGAFSSAYATEEVVSSCDNVQHVRSITRKREAVDYSIRIFRDVNSETGLASQVIHDGKSKNYPIAKVRDLPVTEFLYSNQALREEAGELSGDNLIWQKVSKVVVSTTDVTGFHKDGASEMLYDLIDANGKSLFKFGYTDLDWTNGIIICGK